MGMNQRGILDLRAIGKQFEMLAQYDEAKLVEHDVYQTVRDMMSDDWIARQSCGVWVCNVGEPCDVGE